MRSAFFDRITRRYLRLGSAVFAVLGVLLSLGSVSAFAAAEPHPQIGEFGSFTNPNGIAVDESTGDVYVADLGSATVSQSVSKFDSSGKLIESWGTKGQLTGTPTGPFAFPSLYGSPA